MIDRKDAFVFLFNAAAFSLSELSLSTNAVTCDGVSQRAFSGRSGSK